MNAVQLSNRTLFCTRKDLTDSILTRSINHIAKADMLIIGGTSLAVYPAAGLIDYFHGKYLVVINMASTPRDSYADIVINGKIG